LIVDINDEYNGKFDWFRLLFFVLLA